MLSDESQLDLIRKMPRRIGQAAADGILALLDARPDLRQRLSGADIALLESFRRRSEASSRSD